VKYTVYIDSLTRNTYSIIGGELRKVHARRSFRTHLIEGGDGHSVLTNCSVEVRSSALRPNGWGRHSFEDQQRAAAALKPFTPGGDLAACKTTKAMV